MPSDRNPIDVAYFSMEVMLESDVPTYAGGLGVLAGDVLRSCADMHIPSVGVTLVYSGDTFDQVINSDGTQTFLRTDWQKLDQLTKLPLRVHMSIGGMPAVLGVWRYDIVGFDGFVVPVYLLDTNRLENPQWIRDFTTNLYGGSHENRFCQELILGIGGVRMLRALGYKDIKTYHLNEGHTAFVPLELLAERGYADEAVKASCVFTSHTPVPEGHDKFDYELAYHFGGNYLPWHIKNLAGNDCLSMTHLAMNLSHKSFAVSQKHKAVSEHILPGFKFDYVTNGIHHPTWAAPTMQNLLDHYMPDWHLDPSKLAAAPAMLPDDRLWEHHQDAKSKLIRVVNHHLTSPNSYWESEHPYQGELFDVNTLTISLARRPVGYKRPLLLYRDLERFVRIGAGRIQVIQCGKSHPDDNISQDFVKEIVKISKKFKDILRIVFLENYSPKITRILVSGSDVWLNNPKRPMEASGTSGMKAAVNGVLNFSVLDGWWIEAYRQNPQAGFAIGPFDDSVAPTNSDESDADDLYEKLEHQIIPLYYEDRKAWIFRMKQAISLGAYFNTNRVVSEYKSKGWDQS